LPRVYYCTAPWIERILKMNNARSKRATHTHLGGLAELAKASGARVLISEADAEVIESGGATDFFFGEEDITRFPPLRVDHRLRDGEEVTLGGIQGRRTTPAKNRE
jgi:glyoxylase-like metal-dependent hydrolase (beta-lactamase superfamily II)